MRVEIAAQKEGPVWDGEGEKVTQVRSFVDDVVVIINNKNGFICV